MKFSTYVIAGITAILLIVCSGFLISDIYFTEKVLLTDSRNLIYDETKGYANKISGLLTAKFNITELLKRQVELLNNTSDNRFSLNELEDLLMTYIVSDADDECKAYWIEFDVDQLPEIVRKNLIARTGIDSKQVVLLAQRWGKEPVLQVLMKDATGHEYYRPLKEGKAAYYVTEPVNYSNLTRDDLVVSVTRPLRYKDKIIGVCGLDLNTVSIRDEVNKIHPKTLGYARLLSSGMLVIADGHDNQQRGRSFTGDENIEKRISTVAEKGVWSGSVRDEISGENNLITSVIVPIGESASYWIYESVLPEIYISQMTGSVIESFRYRAIGAILCSIVIGIMICYVIIRKNIVLSKSFQNVLNSVHLPVTVLNKNKRIVYNNTASKNFLMLEEGDYINSRDSSNVSHNNVVMNGLIDGINKLDDCNEVNLVLKAADNKWDVNITSLLNMQDECVGFVNVINDTSACYRMEMIIRSVRENIIDIKEAGEQIELKLRKASESILAHVQSLEELASFVLKNSEIVNENENGYSELSYNVIKKINILFSQANLLAVNLNSPRYINEDENKKIQSLSEQVQNLSNGSSGAIEDITEIIDFGNDEIKREKELIAVILKTSTMLVNDVAQIRENLSVVSAVFSRQCNNISMLSQELMRK